jgi:ribosomal protein S18 acetylase RimI-like enzyme
MPLSKEQKRLLKKLRAVKFIPIEGISNHLFTFGTFSITYKLSSLGVERLSIVMDMFETNMGKLYQQSSWGLDLESKRRELDHPEARYLFVHKNDDCDDTKPIIGYCHFRFEVDDYDYPSCVVCFVYELQVHSQYQGKGIGKYLMGLIHRIAAKAGLNKVMLTVLNANVKARKFYDTLGYHIDVTSPSQHGENVDYEIMGNDISKLDFNT